MNKFYVYVYLDPRKPGNYRCDDVIFDFEPFYVGKGTGYRCNRGMLDNKNYKRQIKHNKIKSIFNSGYIPIIHKIYENLSESDALILEIRTIELIGKIIDGKGPLFNITDGGEGSSGYKHSEEWKSKLSKPVIQYDMNHNFIKEFDSIKDASLETKIKKQNIGACVNGKYKTSGGYIWVYKNEKDRLQGHLKNSFIMPTHKDVTKKKIAQSNIKSILQYDVGGKFIKEWSSIKEAAEFYKIKGSCISSCCSGVYKTSSGFIWRYKSHPIDVSPVYEYKKISQYDKSFIFIKEWNSAKEIEDVLGFNQINIRSCCRGVKKSCKGFIWRYS